MGFKQKSLLVKVFINIWIIAFVFAVAKLVSLPFTALKLYRAEHLQIYLMMLMLSSIVYAKYYNLSSPWTTNYLSLLKTKRRYIVSISLLGYVFQLFPDIDTWAKVFFNHRSPITHSVIFIWVMWLIIKRYYNNKPSPISPGIRAIYLACVIGISSHLLLDIAYMFKIPSNLTGIYAHKGHGNITLIPTFLEVPYIYFMAFSSLIYLIHLLKGNIRGNLDLNIWCSFKLLFCRELAPWESVLYLFISNLMILKILYIFPGRIAFPLWAIVIFCIMASSFYFRNSDYIKNKKKIYAVVIALAVVVVDIIVIFVAEGSIESTIFDFNDIVREGNIWKIVDHSVFKVSGGEYSGRELSESFVTEYLRRYGIYSSAQVTEILDVEDDSSYYRKAALVTVNTRDSDYGHKSKIRVEKRPGEGWKIVFYYDGEDLYYLLSAKD